MTSTTIRGLGLAEDLDFGPTYSSGNPQTFGEPAIFPGGISFGTVAFVDGKFQTDGGKSSIEVLNLLLGQGNDRFEVLGTLDPDVAVKLIGTIILDGASPACTGFPTAVLKLTRPQPFDWKSQGFLVGQPFHISGFDADLDGRRLQRRRPGRHGRQHRHVPGRPGASRNRRSTPHRSRSTCPRRSPRSQSPARQSAARSLARRAAGSTTASPSASGSRSTASPGTGGLRAITNGAKTLRARGRADRCRVARGGDADREHGRAHGLGRRRRRSTRRRRSRSSTTIRIRSTRSRATAASSRGRAATGPPRASRPASGS